MNAQNLIKEKQLKSSKIKNKSIQKSVKKHVLSKEDIRKNFFLKNDDLEDQSDSIEIRSRNRNLANDAEITLNTKSDFNLAEMAEFDEVESLRSDPLVDLGAPQSISAENSAISTDFNEKISLIDKNGENSAISNNVLDEFEAEEIEKEEFEILDKKRQFNSKNDDFVVKFDEIRQLDDFEIRSSLKDTSSIIRKQSKIQIRPKKRRKTCEIIALLSNAFFTSFFPHKILKISPQNLIKISKIGEKLPNFGENYEKNDDENDKKAKNGAKNSKMDSKSENKTISSSSAAESVEFLRADPADFYENFGENSGKNANFGNFSENFSENVNFDQNFDNFGSFGQSFDEKDENEESFLGQNLKNFISIEEEENFNDLLPVLFDSNEHFSDPKMNIFYKTLKENLKKSKNNKIRLEEIFSGEKTSKKEIAFCFYKTLELKSAGVIDVEQKTPFSDIFIKGVLV